MRVTAPDEESARTHATDTVEHCMGVQLIDDGLFAEIRSASADGDHDLIEIDGEEL